MKVTCLDSLTYFMAKLRGYFVKKTGDTMTGDLTIKKDRLAGGLCIQNDRIDSTGGAPSEAVYAHAIESKDENGKVIGVLESHHWGDDQITWNMKAQREVNGDDVIRGLSVILDSDGKLTYDGDIFRFDEGSLLFKNMPFALSSSADNDLSQDMYPGIKFNDENNLRFATYETLLRKSDGLVQSYLLVRNIDTNGNEVANQFTMGVRKNGDRFYSVTSPAAFRTAIGVGGLGNRVTKDQSSAVSMTNNSWSNNICSVSLAAGTWVITATLQIASNATGRRIAVLSTAASNTNPSAADRRQCSMEVRAVDGDSTYLNISTTMVLSATTTVYLKGHQNSGSALSAYGFISAVRII